MTALNAKTVHDLTTIDSNVKAAVSLARSLRVILAIDRSDHSDRADPTDLAIGGIGLI